MQLQADRINQKHNRVEEERVVLVAAVLVAEPALVVVAQGLVLVVVVVAQELGPDVRVQQVVAAAQEQRVVARKPAVAAQRELLAEPRVAVDPKLPEHPADQEPVRRGVEQAERDPGPRVIRSESLIELPGHRNVQIKVDGLRVKCRKKKNAAQLVLPIGATDHPPIGHPAIKIRRAVGDHKTK